MGIDIGKNSFHVVGLDQCGAIALRQKWSRRQIEVRLANIPPCLIGTEACVGAHHLSRKLQSHGHDARLMPAKYVRPYSKGQKNDFRDAEAIVEAVQRPTMKFVATKTADQLDLQALHRVRERLVSQRTGIINQIRAFLLERGVTVRQGLRFLRIELPGILATRSDVLSSRMMHVIKDLAGDWRQLDERIEGLSTDIKGLADQDPACERLMTVPGIGPIISHQSVPSPMSSPQASQRPSTSWKRCCFVAGENDRAAVRRNGFGPPVRLMSCFIGANLFLRLRRRSSRSCEEGYRRGSRSCEERYH
jgi:transposase